ncbi:metal ABC transporter permease [Clostridia bacterium]|nr:metal ABC transporter permease [Clostridia bacterium]
MFHYTFIITAILATILSGLLSGVLGPIVMQKRLTMISGGMAHIAFGGIGLGYFIGVNPLLSGIGFSILVSLILANNANKLESLQEGYIAMFWALGMALGVIFISATPLYTPPISSFLFGNILSVTRPEIAIMSVMTLLILIVFLTRKRQWELFLFDEEYYRSLRFDSNRMQLALYLFLAVSIIVLIRMVGIILIIALFSIPTLTATFFTRSFGQMMVFSILFATLTGLVGFAASYAFNLPSGAAMVLLMGIFHGIALLIAHFRNAE